MMEIDDETCNEIFVLAKKIMNILKDVYNAESVYLCTMCDGPMNHFHIQLIPRYSFEKRGSKNFVKPRFEYKEDKEKYFDDHRMWDEAENKLREVLNEYGCSYTEAKGEAAFYGPKLDVEVKPAVGPEVTLSTCQLDFLLPRRFDLSYIDREGNKQIPVVIHRAILGTLDRFMAFLIEETKGAFPTWLSPLQVKVLPISDKHLEYANEVKKALEEKDVRVEVDERAEKIGYKIREAQLQKVPYMLVVGDLEEASGEVGVRNRKDGDLGAMKLEDFVSKIDSEIRNFENK